MSADGGGDDAGVKCESDNALVIEEDGMSRV
jgi:hypothetical protein